MYICTVYLFGWIAYKLYTVQCALCATHAYKVQKSLYFTTLYFKTTLDYKTTQFGPNVPLCVLNDLYFKTTCNIRPHFLGPKGGLKIEGLLY